MIILRWVLLPTASTALLACALMGCAAAPEFAACIAVLACMVTLGVYASRQRSGSSTSADARVEAVVIPGLLAGAAATTVVMAVLGLCVLCGTASLALLTTIVLAAVVPVWRGWGRHRLARPVIHVVVPHEPPSRTQRSRLENHGEWSSHVPMIGRDTVPGVVADEIATALAQMTIDQLCRAWRRSWLSMLDRDHDPDEWDQLASVRRGYLDELERRDPHGVARWLGSGARAGGDPAKFLTPPPQFDETGEGPAANHQLTE